MDSKELASRGIGLVGAVPQTEIEGLLGGVRLHFTRYPFPFLKVDAQYETATATVVMDRSYHADRYYPKVTNWPAGVVVHSFAKRGVVREEDFAANLAARLAEFKRWQTALRARAIGLIPVGLEGVVVDAVFVETERAAVAAVTEPMKDAPKAEKPGVGPTQEMLERVEAPEPMSPEAFRALEAARANQ